MERLLEVREFDSITGSSGAEGDDRLKRLKAEEFQNLIRFIKEFSGDEKTADALDFMRISYRRDLGDVVTVKSYVGLIELKNGYQIHILPKISFAEGDDAGNHQTKRIFLKMLRSMKNFPGKSFNFAGLQADQMNLYEIFINMYLQEVRCLVKRGIKSNYIQQENNLKFFKGKLMTGEHIKANAAHGERFYVSYDEFHPNRPENRLVKATLLRLQRLTSSAKNAREIRQLLLSFEMVDSSENYEEDFAHVSISRNTKEYEMLMQWSRVFLQGRSFTTFSGNTQARALLFPMESVFESYAEQQMKKIFGPSGWIVSGQDTGHYLFTEPDNKFALRPDIVCTRGRRTVIMDTKWKSLIRSESRNYGISQGDMYQMYAYSKKYRTPEIWLLYPLNDEMRGHDEIRFDSGDGTTVRLHFIDVAQIEDSLNQLREKIEAE